jgi:hypothetical protein
MTSPLKTFIYEDQLYVRLIPSKRMFQSSLIHQVVNRGDIFAMRVSDQQFTVIPGKAEVVHTLHTLVCGGEQQAKVPHDSPTAQKA